MRLALTTVALVLAVHASADIAVDAHTRLVLGEQDQVSANLFGMTAFEGFPSVINDRDYRARVAALRPGCIRLAGSLAWCCPKEYDPAWYDTPEAMRVFTQVLLFGDRYPTGRFLPVVRELGAEPMCQLAHPPPYLTQEGTSHPSDFDQWAEYCARYVGLWKQCDPGLRLVQIWNEPNASWYNDPRPRARGITDAELHIQMANKVSRAIKARFPDLLIGGPVLCWPPGWPAGQQGLPPWYTFDKWTRPWLRDTRDTIDFFDFHVYNVSPEDFAVQTEMVANEAFVLQGRRLPIWITESNYDLAPEELTDPKATWRKRMLPYERLLLRGMLPQADKIAGNLYHDLHARSFTLLPGSADSPDPAYWLLWILRDLRGTRIVANSTDPDVLCCATIEEDGVCLVVFNDSAQEKAIPVTMALPGGWWTGPDVRAIGESDEGACQRLALGFSPAREAPGARGTLTLPPHATASILLRTSGFYSPPKTRLITEHFGDRTLQLLKGTDPVSVTIALPDDLAGARPALRLGLLGAEGSEKLAGRLNGAEVAVLPVALQDIPLAPGALKPDTTLELKLAEPADNPRLALAFASITLETAR
ncbi:MAG: hypothetical protein FJX75_14785 [Armatimonadetes bacterium]|nr:hypothetical protein [Armatimonadota bacterium]